MLNKYLRQLDYLDPEVAEHTEITLVGAGGIGSWTGLTLAKTGFKNVVVFDHDFVEEHNVSNQGYSENDIGELKVDALNKALEYFGETPFYVRSTKVTSMSRLGEIVISGVDSIEARKEIYEAAIDSNSKVLIDGRMGLTTMHIYCIDLSNEADREYYEQSLEDETVDAPCTARTTMSTAVAIAGLIVSNVINFVNNAELQRHEVYDTKSHGHLIVES